MRLLIITQYFPPEVGAPQVRLYEMAVRLQKQGVDVTVLTAMPNYPDLKIFPEYKGKWFAKEKMDGLRVFRSWIYTGSRSSIFSRLLIYFSFVFSAMWRGIFHKGRYDYVFCQSPPLFLGITSYVVSRWKRAKLIFNVSDLWPESAEKLGIIKSKSILRFATWLEEFLYRKAYFITVQTQGIQKNIKRRFPHKEVFWFKNGVDLSYFNPDAYLNDDSWRKAHGFDPDKLLVLYAGNLGFAQGVDVVLRAADELRNEQGVEFVIIGGGPEKENLLRLYEELQLPNLRFLPLQPKTEMPRIVAACDISIVPLKRLDIFKGALPSKVFEILAMKKPILLGVEGEAKELFIDEGKAGLAFIPEDAKDLANKIRAVNADRSVLGVMGDNARAYVAQHFDRDTMVVKFRELMERMLKR